MNIYGDESGSINNHSEFEKHFVIALIKVNDKKKVQKAYKRFVSSNFERLKILDRDKYDEKGNLVREGHRMFDIDGNFIELKGSQFDREMKIRFVQHFIKYGGFEVFFIHVLNNKLTDTISSDTSTAYNYPMKLALSYFYKKGYIPNEDLHLQLDMRNEKTDKKFFLEQYLNVELHAQDIMQYPIDVKYFDSKQNRLVQVADVLANLYYSQLKSQSYTNEIKALKDAGILTFVFRFPLG